MKRTAISKMLNRYRRLHKRFTKGGGDDRASVEEYKLADQDDISLRAFFFFSAVYHHSV